MSMLQRKRKTITNLKLGKRTERTKGKEKMEIRKRKESEYWKLNKIALIPQYFSQIYINITLRKKSKLVKLEMKREV